MGNSLEPLLYLLPSGIDALIVLLPCHRLLPHRFRGARQIMVSVCCCLLLMALTLSMSDDSIMERSGTVSLFIFFFCLFLYRAPICQSGFFCMLGIYTLLPGETIASNILGHLFQFSYDLEFMNSSLVWIPTSVSLITSFLLCLWVTSYFRRMNRDLPVKQWIIMDVVMICFFLAATAFYELDMNLLNISQQYGLHIAGIYVLYYIMNGFVFYFFVEISNYHIQEKEYLLNSQKLEFLEEEIRSEAEQEKAIRQLRHDMANHLSNIVVQLKNEETQKAICYAEDLAGKVEETKVVPYSGNSTLNAVLSIKRTVAEKNGIEMETVIAGRLPMLTMTDLELASILGNLLDNAVEAARKLPEGERRVWVKINRNENYMIIRIKNTFDGSPQKESGGVLMTTKRDKAYHGYGMKSVQEVTERYGGSFVYTAEGKLFTATVLLPVEERECHSGRV